MATMVKVADISIAAAGAGTLLLGNVAKGRTGIMVIQVVGAITGTITVQGAGDVTVAGVGTWVSTLARPTGSTTAATTITAAGIYHIEASGMDIRLSWPGTETGTPAILRDNAVG